MPIRDLQVRMAEVGRIRTGWKDPNEKYAEKLESFRFTSPSEGLILRIAELYGGTPRVWKPQNKPNEPQWEVFSEASEIEVLVPYQVIDPNMEAWKPGTRIRLCDGETMSIPRPGPCECKLRNLTGMDTCKPTVRVNVELARVPVLGWWRLDSHGWNACSRFAAIAPLVQIIPPDATIPGMLILTRQTQRQVNPQGGKDLIKDYMVPWIRIDGVSSQQWQLGGSTLQRAIQAAHAASAPPALSSAERPALEAVQAGLPDQVLHEILQQIEQCDLDGLEKVRQELSSRGIRDKPILDAWISKRNSILAQARIDEAREMNQRHIQQSLAAVPQPPPYEPDWIEPADEAPVVDSRDPEEEYALLFNLAGPLGWTTAQTNDAIKQFCKVDKVGDATGDSLYAMRQVIKAGQLR